MNVYKPKIDRRANLDHKSQYQMEILNLGILMMKLMRCYFKSSLQGCKELFKVHMLAVELLVVELLVFELLVFELLVLYQP